ncbi:MAG: asparaginase [Rhodospirillaceae bacterium]|nr:asparaginase [Rhodospirillaceae bacterium]
MTDDPSPNPVLINVTRSGFPESVHRGAVCVIDADGETVLAAGAVGRPVLPRSAIKPLQAIPFIEDGAADVWKATGDEIALACASHSGDPIHVRTGRRWLHRLDVPEAALACGPHLPLGHMSGVRMEANGEAPTRLHNNCSGKHLAMISAALNGGQPLDGYARPDHPVQRRIREILSEMTEADLTVAALTVDGCGAPCWAIPLHAIARGFARFADTRGLPVPRQSAIRRLRVAIASYPEHVAGSERFDTALIRRKGHGLVVKTGAEGVYAAALPYFGLGVALKIDDGARRAAEVAMAAILRYLELLDDTDWAALRPYVEPPIRNASGEIVGSFDIAPGWLGRL